MQPLKFYFVGTIKITAKLLTTYLCPLRYEPRPIISFHRQQDMHHQEVTQFNCLPHPRVHKMENRWRCRRDKNAERGTRIKCAYGGITEELQNADGDTMLTYVYTIKTRQVYLCPSAQEERRKHIHTNIHYYDITWWAHTHVKKRICYFF